MSRIKGELIFTDKHVDDKICPVCGKPYELITREYIYLAHDKKTKEERKVFIVEAEYACDVCGYITQKFDTGFCDYENEK